jgi:hypothetical protein
MKNSGLNIINLLILLVFIILIRDVVIFYLYNTVKEEYNKENKLDEFSALFAVFMLIITFYLVRKFTFSNKLLLLVMYYLLFKSSFIILNYFQKKYNVLGLDVQKRQKLEEFSRTTLIASSSISLLLTAYVVYYIYFHF